MDEVTEIDLPAASAAIPTKAGGHKFDHGHAVVLAGGFGRTGAARLAAMAALRIGTGLVTVAAPGAAMLECAAHLTAVMLARCDDADALGGLLGDARITALCAGPGLGTGARELKLIGALLASGRPCVLDADAITILSSAPKAADAVHTGCLLTPHEGEFARLWPGIDLAGDRIDAARTAAACIGATVLLKGAETVVAAPDGRAAIHRAAGARAAPWLATAGAGDVLSGVAAGLMARGATPFDAACAAAWLHVECALAVGPGLISEDLPGRIPGVLARLGA